MRGYTRPDFARLETKDKTEKKAREREIEMGWYDI